MEKIIVLIRKVIFIQQLLLKRFKNYYRYKVSELDIQKQVLISPSYFTVNSVFEGFNVVSGEGRISNCTIGSYTYIQTNTLIGNTDVGRYCSIGPHVMIGQGDHPVSFLSTHPMFYSDFGKFTPWELPKFVENTSFIENKRVVIHSDVWIGANSYIKNGVEIGVGSVVAAGAVVVKDIPPYCIYGGVPAKLIKKRFSDSTITLLLESKWWDKEISILNRLRSYFHINLDDDTAREFLTKLKQESVG